MKKVIKSTGYLAMFAVVVALGLPVIFFANMVNSEPFEKPVVRTQALYLNNAQVTATAAEINAASDVSSRVQEMTVSGTVLTTTRVLELSHGSTIIAATLAAPAGELFFVKDTSASGTAAHTATLSSGTWNGTNTILTLDAPNEAVMVQFDSAGDGTIIENVGTVSPSGP